MVGHRRIGLVALLVVVLAGCGMTQKPIPPDAQVLHLVITPAEIRLEPATARAGYVYVVLDTPNTGYTFVSTGLEADGEIPLTDDDLARLSRGDQQGMSFAFWGGEQCSPEQITEGRGKMGPPCGNVAEMNLTPGRYAFLIEADTGPPTAMAVLQVVS
jgi:hypothetical protein